MATDFSYMKENLVYNIAESVDLPASKFSFARVYINDRAIGLFGVAETLTSPWVRNEFGNVSKKFKQGALYEADPSEGKNIFGAGGLGEKKNQTQAAEGNIQNSGTHANPCDLSYLGNNVSLYAASQSSVKEDPTVGTANFTRIMDFTKFVSEQPNVTAVDNSAVPLWKEKIYIDSFLRGLALEIAVSNSDAYFTAANNYVLYDDIENERLIFSGQDFDLTMRTTMYNVSLMNGGNYLEFPGVQSRPLLTRMLAVPQLKQDFENLLYNITKNLINLEVLSPRIDQTSAMIKDVLWDFSLPRVGSNILLGGLGSKVGNATSIGDMIKNISYESAINGPSISSISMSLKEWLTLRSSNLLTFFNRPN